MGCTSSKRAVQPSAGIVPGSTPTRPAAPAGGLVAVSTPVGRDAATSAIGGDAIAAPLPAAAAAPAPAPASAVGAQAASAAAAADGATGAAVHHPREAALRRRRKNLIAAAKKGNLEDVLGLLAAGEDINKRGMWGNTPLICACQYNQPAIATALIDAGADAAVVNEKGCSALLHAALEGMEDVVNALVVLSSMTPDLCRSPGVIYNRGTDSTQPLTPLVAATVNGHVSCAQALVDAGARYDETVAQSAGLSHWWQNNVALVHGSDSAPAAEIDAGEAAKMRAMLTDASAQRSPLAHASYHGHAALVRLFLDMGASGDAQGEGAWSPLALACSRGNAREALMLLDAGVVVHPAARAAAVDPSTVHGQGGAGAGAASTASPAEPASVLHLACEWAQPAVVSRLLDAMAEQLDAGEAHDAVINGRDRRQRTPLLVAVAAQRPKRAADKSNGPERRGVPEVVEQLVRAGADPLLTGASGKTALAEANRRKLHSVAAVLERFGAPESEPDATPVAPGAAWAGASGVAGVGVGTGVGVGAGVGVSTGAGAGTSVAGAAAVAPPLAPVDNSGSGAGVGATPRSVSTGSSHATVARSLDVSAATAAAVGGSTAADTTSATAGAAAHRAATSESEVASAGSSRESSRKLLAPLPPLGAPPLAGVGSSGTVLAQPLPPIKGAGSNGPGTDVPLRLLRPTGPAEPPPGH